jgi:hypothetical protein
VRRSLVAKKTLSLGIKFIAVVAVLVLVPAALAGKGVGGGKGNDPSAIDLVVLDSADGLPHWGGHVTFNVSSTAAYQPYVTLNCYQNGVWVLTGTRGFYAGSYGQTFGLSSAGWAGGSADCTADLFALSSNGRSTTLSTTSFHVYA